MPKIFPEAEEKHPKAYAWTTLNDACFEAIDLYHCLATTDAKVISRYLKTIYIFISCLHVLLYRTIPNNKTIQYIAE